MNSLLMQASRRRLRFIVPALLMFCAAAGASTPNPASNLQAAQQAIANAERVEAAKYSGVELGEAREKLAGAQRAVGEKHMVVAAQLADEARAAAELAAAKSSAAKAEAVNLDMKHSTDTLIDEMQRKTGENR
jgi:TPP-dependent indolepyruvate ferredoxin oxidoreductase alpha subunit